MPDDGGGMDEQVPGVLRDGCVTLEAEVDWPDGTRVVVRPMPSHPASFAPGAGRVVIAGYGLAGRCVADLLEQSGIEYVVIESNATTVETQRSLGRRFIEGNVSDERTLIDAGIRSAPVLALTVPDEEAVLAATAAARRLNPEVYIIARTTYASRGMRAAQLGANEVIKSEQAVALLFYEKLRHRLVVRSTKID